MKLRKFISSSLIVGLLLNNSLASLASNISEDGRYETFEGSNITIDNALEEDELDVEIEGNTLVNLVQTNGVGSHPGGLFGTSGNGNMDKVEIENGCRYITRENGSSYITIRTDSHELLKPNTTYTISFNILENTFGNYDGVAIRSCWDSFYPTINHDDILYFDSTFSTSVGVKKIKFTTSEDISSYTGLGVGFRHKGGDAAGLVFAVSDVMLLEGDWTNKEVPEYFKGLKSVGQNDDDYKLDVVSSRGRSNLIRNSGFLNGYSEYNLYKSPIITLLDDSNSGSGKILKIEVADANGGLYQSNIVSVVENKKYTLSGWVKGDIGSHVDISLESHKARRIKFSDNEWVRFEIVSDLNPVNWNRTIIFYGIPSSTFYLKDIKLEEGDGATSYVPNVDESNYDNFLGMQKKEILLNEPLRRLPNGVKDRIIKKDGQWVVERNCKEVVLDGSSKYTFYVNYFKGPNADISNFSVSVRNDDSIKQCQDGDILSDRIPQGKGHYVHRNNFNISTYIDKTALFVGTIPNSYLDTVDVDGLIKYFNENTSNIVYQLAEPVYEPLNIDLTVNTYLETTYVSNNSTIPANMKVTVDRVANRAYEAIELAKQNPTVENISQARYWINLMKESLLKDEFQNDINEISEIADLEIEKKTATANLDLYVKSNNSLTMSLSTNSVTFENYSGVEDLEILDAVNITVNSSLPYSLNAYMPTLMSNADGSNTMDVNILNIRENTETSYKQFANTTDKVVLKDDCDAGNNNIHNIDLKLSGNNLHKADVYKTVIKFEAEQK